MKLSKAEYLRKAGFSEAMLASIADVKIVNEAKLCHAFYYHKEHLFTLCDCYEEPYQYQIYLSLYCTLFYQRYINAKNVLEETICIDGCKDFVEWAKLCYEHYQVWGIPPYIWKFLDRLIEGKITRLGRLEFEPKAIQKEIHLPTISLPQNSILLNVHIPSGPRLTKAEIDSSYQQALTYFNGILPIFHCSSWLLAPQLDECLPTNSTILQFKKDYILYDVEDNSDQFIERVWPQEENNPKDYIHFEETTTLQKKGKQLLLSGRNIQKASGICIRYYSHE